MVKCISEGNMNLRGVAALVRKQWEVEGVTFRACIVVMVH